METDKEQLLEAYFAGSLSADQQQQFEWLLKHDSDFLETVTFEKETRDAITFNERSKLKERFHALEQQTKPSRNLTPWFYAAASILILCVAGWLIFKTQSQSGLEGLYAHYMEPYPNVINPKVRGESQGDNTLSEALALYDKGAYEKAADLLEQAQNANPNDQVAFYLAICQMMLNNPEEAILLLESGEWKSSSTPSETVKAWYLGLAFLHNGDREQALSQFKQVAASGDSLSDSAKKVVEELENIE